MKPLSLDCLTMLEVPAAEMIRVAAEAGYSTVSVWVQAPVLPGGSLAAPDMAADIKRAVQETGVTVGNLEVFNLNTPDPIADYKLALEFGASLGARTATAINYGAPRADIADRFAEFFELAGGFGLRALVEPISMGVTRTIAEGVTLIEQAGVDSGVVVDCIHLIRTGCGARDIASADPRRIAYVQICDGLLNLPEDQFGLEGTAERFYPGEGDFPLADILRAVPPNAALALEAPSLSRRERGESPLQRAKAGIAATRRILDLAGVL
jgi:sugar phosphate isomerase/epimerase